MFHFLERKDLPQSFVTSIVTSVFENVKSNKIEEKTFKDSIEKLLASLLKLKNSTETCWEQILIKSKKKISSRIYFFPYFLIFKGIVDGQEYLATFIQKNLEKIFEKILRSLPISSKTKGTCKLLYLQNSYQFRCNL
jgi:hypothetical protein